MIRDLRVYAQACDAEVLHYKDNTDLEIDAVYCRGSVAMTERRRVRVVLECEVEIQDITLAAVQARHEERLRARIDGGWILDLPLEMPSEGQVEDVRLLQEALRADASSLAAWVMHEVASDLEFRGVEEASPPRGAEERILMPIIETLPPAQRHKFREAMAREAFVEVAEEFYESFVMTIHSVEMS